MTGLAIHQGKDASCKSKKEDEIVLRAGNTQPGSSTTSGAQGVSLDVNDAIPYEVPGQPDANVVDDGMEGVDATEYIHIDVMEGGDAMEDEDVMEDLEGEGASAGVDVMEDLAGPGIDDYEDGKFHDTLNQVIDNIIGPSKRQTQLDQQDLPIQDFLDQSPNGLIPVGQSGEFLEPYPEPGAGAPIRAATEAEMRQMEPGDIGALADPENFEVADFMFSTRLSASERERFLNLKKFEGQMPWKTNYMYLKDVDKLPHGPDWKIKPIKLAGNKGTQVMEFHYRDMPDSVRQLLANRRLAPNMHLAPHRHWTSRDKQARRYGDMWKSRWWWAMQAKIKDKTGTVVPFIIMTNDTPLANFCGNKKAHPVYLTIGNIPKETRRKQSSGTTILIGYLPADKITCETNEDKRWMISWDLFHQCMEHILQPLLEASKTGIEAVCGDGQVRRIYPFVVSYITDFPEQCRVATIKNTHCPVCTVNPDENGDLNQNIPLQNWRKAVDAIQEHEDTGSAKFEALGLHQVWPFWTEDSYIDVATIHTPDLLHQLHKGVFKDHLSKWGVSIKGQEAVDDRYKVMPGQSGIRPFSAGITHVSRWTGREMKEMAKVFLPVIADCSPQVVEAARALLDFIYLAHASSLTDQDLDAMDAALAKFHELKDVFESAGVLGSPRGFHNIPKIHMMQHYTHSVRMLGTPDGFNSEASERLHIDFTKAGYRASNNVNETAQMMKFMLRMEAFAMHRAYLADGPYEVNVPDIDEESIVHWDEEEPVMQTRADGQVKEGQGELVEGTGGSWTMEHQEGGNMAGENEAGVHAGNEVSAWVMRRRLIG